ncbi:restriction endonuclease subunit S [Helicobacter pylori]
MDALTTPSNWQKVRLGDIAEIIGGGTPSTQITSFWNGSINWFTPTEIGITKYVHKSQRTITPLGLKKSSAKLLPIGTILLTSRASIGNCAILKVVATTNQGFQSLIPLEKINNEFLYYLILTLKNKLLKLASGSTFLEVSPNKIKNLLIPLPPLNEQSAIANILSDLDRYLYALRALILKKEGVKKALSFELLSQRKRLKGFNQAWQRVRLGDIAEIIGGGTPSTQITSFWNGSINWFTPTEIGITKYVHKSQRTITPLGLKKSSAKLLPIGTILLTSRASIGNCAILKVVATTNQGFQSLIPLEKINNEFLYYLILTLKNKLLKLASGSTFLEVSPNKIKNLLIPLPPNKSLSLTF